jgi:hypothetical protein
MLAFLFISKVFVLAQVPGALVGFVAGAFAPAVGRRIKALFVKEGTVVKADIKAEASKIGSKL